jgi:bis(5'-nucleosyl)-tetraphosphatase (symmetrical)
MPTYVIGDIHGCFRTLQRLLQKIGYSTPHDRLWLVGDLVSRGPSSLEVLRWARNLGNKVVTVLGNHDLHFLARALGIFPPKKKDQAFLAAEDKTDLLEWLLGRPLVQVETPYILVHAGLWPQWSTEDAQAYSREVERILRGPRAGAAELLKSLAWDEVPAWDGQLFGLKKHVSTLRAMTELRTIRRNGTMCLDFAGPLLEVPKANLPWFSFQSRQSQSHTILFGHWAALDFYRAPGIVCLDSGCSWGRTLTAIRLEDQTVFQQPYAEDNAS